MPTPTGSDFAIAAGGSVGLNLPTIGKIPLASGYVLYTYPGYVAGGGNINASLLGGALSVKGGIDGQVNFQSGQFNFEGFVQLHVLFLDVGSDAVVSSSGIAGCGYISIFGNQVAVAGGAHWGQGPSVWFSCDLSDYKVTVPATVHVLANGRTVAATGYKVVVPKGLQAETIRVQGSGGPPDITITGPGGVRASTGGASQVTAKPFVIYRTTTGNATYIGIIKPAGGTYTITANAGSPAIKQVQHADSITPSVHAKLARTGARMVLTYTDHYYRGQKITFLERTKLGVRQIGTTTAGHGTFRFTPAPGSAGTRQILAEISQGGVPVVLNPKARGAAADQLVVASYRAAGPRRL